MKNLLNKIRNRFVKVTKHFGYRRFIDKNEDELFGREHYYIYEIVDGKPKENALDVRYTWRGARWMCKYYESRLELGIKNF